MRTCRDPARTWRLPSDAGHQSSAGSPECSGTTAMCSLAAASRAAGQPPKTLVTTLAEGQSSSANRASASPPRRRACVSDQSYEEGSSPWLARHVRIASSTRSCVQRRSMAPGWHALQYAYREVQAVTDRRERDVAGLLWKTNSRPAKMDIRWACLPHRAQCVRSRSERPLGSLGASAPSDGTGGPPWRSIDTPRVGCWWCGGRRGWGSRRCWRRLNDLFGRRTLRWSCFDPGAGTVATSRYRDRLGEGADRGLWARLGFTPSSRKRCSSSSRTARATGPC
jgi:hypothetical protein